MFGFYAKFSIKLIMLKKLIKSFLDPIRAINDLLLNNELKRFIVNPKNPLYKFGKRCYSQCDEDGITLEIVRRLNIKKGVWLFFLMTVMKNFLI